MGLKSKEHKDHKKLGQQLNRLTLYLFMNLDKAFSRMATEKKNSDELFSV